MQTRVERQETVERRGFGRAVAVSSAIDRDGNGTNSLSCRLIFMSLRFVFLTQCLFPPEPQLSPSLGQAPPPITKSSFILIGTRLTAV